jgi:prevent-host-death family protein
MEDFQKIEAVSKVKRELLEFLKNVEEEDATVAITRNGEAVGVLMSMDRYQSMLETIEILSDRSILKALRKSETDFSQGKVVQHKDVWKNA